MANIKITVEGPLMDGHKVTFKAPCNCDVVEKLDVRYIENNTQKSKLFTMKDSHGNDLTGLGNLFYKDAYVDVVLDPNSGSAYLQNAGTNGYLEGKITPVDNLESDRADLPLSARQGKILNERLTVYSTEEKVVGTWINGKPIYSKTLDLGNLTQYGMVYNNTVQTPAVPLDDLSIDCIIDITYRAFRLDNTADTQIINGISNGEANISYWYYGMYKTLNFYIGKQYTTANSVNNHFVVTLYYTKTTD